MIYGVIQDDMLPAYGNRRATVLQAGDEAGDCPCGKIVKFKPSPLQKIQPLQAVFCNDECFAEHSSDYLPVIEFHETVAVKEDAREPCPAWRSTTLSRE